MHMNSKLIFREYAQQLFADDMRVLEIGPDAIPSTYQRLVNDPSIKWHTLDLSQSQSLTYVATDEYSFPIETGTYDIVVSGQVIEHVRKVWVWIREVARVCKCGGTVITIAPINWGYHEAPIDCWRIYPEGMCALYEEAGLDLILCKPVNLDAQQYVCSATGISGRKDARAGRKMWPVDLIAIGTKRAACRS